MLPEGKTYPKLLLITRLMVLIISAALVFTGCNKSDKDESKVQRQSTQQEQQSEKIPAQLTDIEKSIENIVKTLNGPAVEITEEKQGKDTQGGAQGQESGGENKSQDTGEQQGEKQQGEQGGEQGQGQGGQGAQQGQGQAQKQPQAQDPWQTLTPVINDLHYKWNSYMPLAVKKGADKKLIDNFSAALNSLTNTIITKNKTNTLMAASFLYAYVPDFYSLYKTSSSPEIKRMRHYTRNAMLNAMTANWAQADFDMNSLKSSWALYKNIVGKEQQDSANKLDFSIYELDKVVKERNQPIIDIKGRITLSNIQALEKSMDKSSGQGGQEEGSGGEGGSQGGGD